MSPTILPKPLWPRVISIAFIIVGSVPHGADPHHECSERVLQAGDMVVVDIRRAIRSRLQL